jgi:hypothetical protein
MQESALFLNSYATAYYIYLYQLSLVSTLVARTEAEGSKTARAHSEVPSRPVGPDCDSHPIRSDAIYDRIHVHVYIDLNCLQTQDQELSPSASRSSCCCRSTAEARSTFSLPSCCPSPSRCCSSVTRSAIRRKTVHEWDGTQSGTLRECKRWASKRTAVAQCVCGVQGSPLDKPRPAWPRAHWIGLS